MEKVVNNILGIGVVFFIVGLVIFLFSGLYWVIFEVFIVFGFEFIVVEFVRKYIFKRFLLKVFGIIILFFFVLNFLCYLIFLFIFWNIFDYFELDLYFFIYFILELIWFVVLIWILR